MMKFSTWSFVAGVMVGVLVTGAWFLSGNAQSIPMVSLHPLSSFNATSTTPIQNKKSDALSVADQQSGDTVLIESVTVPPPGVWIAVREVNGNDLGNVLGAERVGGPRSNVSVSLLRSTEPNHLYAVELYRDDNNGTFDPSANSAYVDFDTGDTVIVYFSTTN
jgi:hypothetical protein